MQKSPRHFLNFCLLWLFFPLCSGAVNLNCLGSVAELPRLQNSTDPKSFDLKIDRIETDSDGIWFVLNKDISKAMLKSESLIGINRVVQGKTWIPHPNTMTALLKKNRPQNPLNFIAHPEGVLRIDDYLILLSQDKMPIGFDGLFLHDVLDHSLGYAILAETPAWSKLKSAIRLTIEAQNKSTKVSQIVQTFLVKINAFLEASTTALPGIFENTNKIEQAEEYQLIYRQVDRLLEKAIEINSSVPTK